MNGSTGHYNRQGVRTPMSPLFEIFIKSDKLLFSLTRIDCLRWTAACRLKPFDDCVLTCLRFSAVRIDYRNTVNGRNWIVKYNRKKKKKYKLKQTNILFNLTN